MATKPVFVMYTQDNSGLPIALHLQAEGYSVIMAMIEPKAAGDKYTPPKGDKDIKKEKEKLDFLQLAGLGMIPKVWAKEMTQKLVSENLQDKTYVLFDQIYGFKYAEILRKKGYKVWGGHRLGYELELDREKSMVLFKKIGYDILPIKEFPPNSADAGIQFLKSVGNTLFVFKSHNPDVWTTVASENNDELIEKLVTEKDKINSSPFILQKKIEGLEWNIDCWLSNGVPIMCNIDIEAKKKFNEMSSPQCGDSGSVIWVIPVNHPLRKNTLARLDEFMRENTPTGCIDSSFIYDPINRKNYILELCGNRFGYNAVYGLLTTLKIQIGEFFIRFLNGEFKKDIGKLFSGYGCTMTIFNDKKSADQYISYPKSMEKDVWLWDVTMKGKNMVTTGLYDDTAAVLTNRSDTPEGGFANLKSMFPKFHMASKWARSDLTKDDSTLPVGRFRWMKSLGLLGGL